MPAAIGPSRAGNLKNMKSVFGKILNQTFRRGRPREPLILKLRIQKIRRPFPFRWSKAGFSLLEILIVITIMGILTAIVAPRVSQYIEDTKIAAAQRELESFKKALTSIYNKRNPRQYPRRLKSVAPYFDGGNFAPNGDILDPWNNPYQYQTFPSGGLERQRFEIRCAGPDGLFGQNPQSGRTDDLLMREGRRWQGQSGDDLEDEYEDFQE